MKSSLSSLLVGLLASGLPVSVYSSHMDQRDTIKLEVRLFHFFVQMAFHLIQSKHQSTHMAWWAVAHNVCSWPRPLSELIYPNTFSSPALFLPHWFPGSSSNARGFLLLQRHCVCLNTFLECSLPHGLVPHNLQVFAPMSPPHWSLPPMTLFSCNIFYHPILFPCFILLFSTYQPLSHHMFVWLIDLTNYPPGRMNALKGQEFLLFSSLL